ncbi:hypothetical protein N9V88_02610 [bacterium]|nr:hypothetical protein [bacterium]
MNSSVPSTAVSDSGSFGRSSRLVSLYSADQIQFINLVIDHLVHNGMMNPTLLFEPPFTDFHVHGVAGVLEDDAEKIIGVIEQINANVGIKLA